MAIYVEVRRRIVRRVIYSNMIKSRPHPELYHNLIKNVQGWMLISMRNFSVLR